MPVSATERSFSNAAMGKLPSKVGNRSVRSPGWVLLALRAVARLGGLLGRAPPGLVGDVPVDRLLEALGEVGVRRPPAELALELGGVDGVAAVVAGAVGDPVEVLGVAPMASRIMRRTVMLFFSPSAPMR